MNHYANNPNENRVTRRDVSREIGSSDLIDIFETTIFRYKTKLDLCRLSISQRTIRPLDACLPCALRSQGSGRRLSSIKREVAMDRDSRIAGKFAASRAIIDSFTLRAAAASLCAVASAIGCSGAGVGS